MELSHQDILRILRSEVAKAGSQMEWAKRNKVSRTQLNKVLNGERDHFGPAILKALRIKQIFVWDR